MFISDGKCYYDFEKTSLTYHYRYFRFKLLRYGTIVLILLLLYTYKHYNGRSYVLWKFVSLYFAYVNRLNLKKTVVYRPLMKFQVRFFIVFENFLKAFCS